MGGCEKPAQPTNLQPTADRSVVNLYIVPRTSNLTLLNYASGRLYVRGRCLVLDTGYAVVTPVFERNAADVTVSSEGLVVGREVFHFSKLYGFPGLSPAEPFPQVATGCPRQRSFVEGMDLTIPKPPPPPPKPPGT
jgi:hypothetical protein